ncbi:hypothetical protein HID58_083282 [Brassica napus]|uniref:Isopenicillin N synthase-like Fe(2+) 2OG dioxygenase domain-containing protein n=1 Tax=Brassica napus TaxID=3708 RepID=A0ABQ7YD55_BRANA|nr:hypothetical protein HID58_083282 [Brassica napus]
MNKTSLIGYTLITSRTWNAPIHCSRSAITTSRVFSLTLGLTKFSDNSFLTVLLQDHVGGLQVLHDQYWVDVPPVLGALVVNTYYKRQVHKRVLANAAGACISVACFFSLYLMANPRVYVPIKELMSQQKPPIYRDRHHHYRVFEVLQIQRIRWYLWTIFQDLRMHKQITRWKQRKLLPCIFHDSPSNLENPKPLSSDLLHLTTIPTIDLEGRVFEDETKRKNTVDEVKDAAEKNNSTAECIFVYTSNFDLYTLSAAHKNI